MTGAPPPTGGVALVAPPILGVDFVPLAGPPDPDPADHAGGPVLEFRPGGSAFGGPSGMHWPSDWKSVAGGAQRGTRLNSGHLATAKCRRASELRDRRCPRYRRLVRGGTAGERAAARWILTLRRQRRTKSEIDRLEAPEKCEKPASRRCPRIPQWSRHGERNRQAGASSQMALAW